jgi:hypothetical protein
MNKHSLNQASSAFYSGWVRKNTISFVSKNTNLFEKQNKIAFFRKETRMLHLSDEPFAELSTKYIYI